MNLKVPLSMLMVAALVSGAMAADVAPRNPPVKPAGPEISVGWTGVSFGLQGGIGLNKGVWREGPVGSLEPFGTFGETSANYGAFVGYDLQFGKGVIGVEGSVARLQGVVRDDPRNPDLKFQTDLQAMLSTRFGVLPSPGTLVYGRAGVGKVRSTAPAQSWLEPTESYLTSAELGAGIETAITPNLTLRFEGVYLHALENLSVSNGSTSFKPDHLTARIGLAMRPSPVVDRTPVVRNNGQWTGPYLGVMAGGVATSTVNGFGPVVGDTGPVSSLDPAVGVYGGISVQFLDRFVAGAEVEASRFVTRWTISGAIPETRFATADLNYGAFGRLGILVSDETLIYAKAGETGLRTKPSEPYALPGQGAVHLRSFAFGGGVETNLASHLRGRVDATYSKKQSTMYFEEASGTAFVRPDMLQVRFGLAAFY